MSWGIKRRRLYPIAYFWVQLLAVDSYFALSVLYMWAISGTNGSSGFGSVNNEHIESKTYKFTKDRIKIRVDSLLYIAVAIGKSVLFHLRYGECRTPLFFQNVEANATIAVDIRMKHLCPKRNLQEKGHFNPNRTHLMISIWYKWFFNLWWFERIIWREVNGHEKDSAWIRTIGWTHYRSLPMKHVLSNWAFRIVHRRQYRKLSF